MPVKAAEKLTTPEFPTCCEAQKLVSDLGD